MYIPKKLLITGSAGFIGSNFLHFIFQHDPRVEVVSLDKLTYAGNQENWKGMQDGGRHTFVQGDICDRVLVDTILRDHQIDTVLHFAAESHVDRSITGPAAFVETNVVGTFTLLEAVRAYWIDECQWDDAQCRFHHVSTDEVYGQLGSHDPAFTETTAYAPSSPYSASKAASDHFVRAYAHTYGLPMTLSNCSNNYGPYQHAEKLIPTVIRACMTQQAIPVYGDGSNVRDWLHVMDHCSAIYTILTQSQTGETYNIGGKAERNNLSLVRLICQIMDEKRPVAKKHDTLITFVTDRLGHDWRYAIDNRKIQAVLQWEPKYTLEQGLRDTVDYYLHQFHDA